jgi:polysaccharide pyruvyl transferase WcaK-like protein
MNVFCIRPKGFNVGNDAIFIGLKAALDEAFGCFVNLITLPATSRYESQSRGGLTAKTVHEINQYGNGVIVGGGNLYENGELDLNVEALHRLECPLMLFSLSRGRIFNRLDALVDRTDVMRDELIQALNRKAVISLARDEATLDYLRSLGLTKPVLGGCPTIFLDRILRRLPAVTAADTGCTLVSVRNPNLMNISLPRQMRIHDQVESVIRLLRAEGHEDVRLLCHDHRDIPFAASFGTVPYVYISDGMEYLALLRACRLNVTYRVHSALPCMAFGTPFVKLSYDERALSLMKTVGFGDWNIDIVKSRDVLAEIKDRLGSLHRLARVREEASGVWSAIKQTQDTALKKFADAVRAHHAESV